MRRNSGLTAFEVAATLAIIAVLASLVMPPYLRWMQGYRLRGAAINLMADLEMAKIRAIRENSFVTVQFATNGYTVFLDNGVGGGTAGDWVRNGSESLVQYRQMPSGVSVVLADLHLANSRLRFNSRGVPPELAATELIPVANSYGRKELRINRLGSMRIQ
jgi:type IV fimbrial biogenesis protein FimT